MFKVSYHNGENTDIEKLQMWCDYLIKKIQNAALRKDTWSLAFCTGLV